MSEAAPGLLREWLQRQLPGPARDWLAERLQMQATQPSERALHIPLGMIPRRLGKADLELSPSDLAAADAARAGWDPAAWSVDVAARVLVLLLDGGANRGFAARFEDLCRTADLGESIALYSGLPLYPEPRALAFQVGEGLRTNVRAAFEAIAHRNPYPCEQFDEHRWNHMVLKALFIGSALAPIQGLDRRANPELARILCDYAHERWAASRPVSAELWRCVGPFAGAEALADLERVLASEDPRERRAAILALAAAPGSDARALLDRADADSRAALASGRLSWATLTPHQPADGNPS